MEINPKELVFVSGNRAGWKITSLSQRQMFSMDFMADPYPLQQL